VASEGNHDAGLDELASGRWLLAIGDRQNIRIISRWEAGPKGKGKAARLQCRLYTSMSQNREARSGLPLASSQKPSSGL
jgi:hypothetical protein